MSGPACDVCGGSDPPRTPYWRDNQNRTCDPCEARIQQHVEIALSERARPPRPTTEEGRLRQPKCDAVLAYCALPMSHDGAHEYPTAALAAPPYDPTAHYDAEQRAYEKEIE